MLYPEFGQYKSYVDKANPLVNGYQTPEGHIFFIEAPFYEALSGYRDNRPEDFDKIMKAIQVVIHNNPKVIFTGNFESPVLDKKDYIYREIDDITDPLHIFWENKSRGSDYGD
jgi:hypothetical protein